MRLSPETLHAITGRKQRTAQARWFREFMSVDVPCDERGPILTEAAYQQLLLKRLGILPDPGAQFARPRPAVRHTTLDDGDICVFDQRTDERRAPQDCRVYVIGIETMSASDRVVLAYNALCTERSFVAVDESSYIKGPRSRRSLRLIHMSARSRYRAVLTGTPFTQGAVDLYAQMAFLSPKILGYRSFWSFAANHLEYEERKDEYGRKRRTGRIVRSHNTDYLAARIAPYTYQVRKDECLTLPEKLYETRYCSMTSEQRALYDQAKDELLRDREYDDWNPIVVFRLFTVLQTIVCGFWNRKHAETGAAEPIAIAHRRLHLLLDTVAEIPAGEPVVIWAKYRHAVRSICAELSGIYGADAVAPFYGEDSERERNAQLLRWRSGARFLIATQSAGGHGLTLNEAAYMIFYADGFKYSEHIQAEDRNHRIGQQRRPVYITLRCQDSIDERIARALDAKGSALAEFQARVEEYKRQGLRKSVADLVRAL